MKKSNWLVFLAFVLLITGMVSGCAPAPISMPVSPTSTTSPTPSIQTAELVPTATLTEAATITPIPTIEVPSIATEYLTDVKFFLHDPFDSNTITHYIYNWNSPEIGNISNGMFELKGIAAGPGDLSPKRQFIFGNGVIVKFKLQNANGASSFHFYTGYGPPDDFRGFDVTNRKQPRVDLTQGQNYLGEYYFHGNLQLKPDTWYNTLMAIGKNGSFLVITWEPADETHRSVFKTTLGEEWSNVTWAFVINVNEGETMYIDDLYGFSFGEIK